MNRFVRIATLVVASAVGLLLFVGDEPSAVAAPSPLPRRGKERPKVWPAECNMRWGKCECRAHFQPGGRYWAIDVQTLDSWEGTWNLDGNVLTIVEGRRGRDEVAHHSILLDSDWTKGRLENCWIVVTFSRYER